jgi:hypothetical protein
MVNTLKRWPSKRIGLLYGFIGLSLVLGPVGAQSPANSSLKDGKTETAPRLKETSREDLLKTIGQLTENVALANAEADFFRQLYQEKLLRDTALGIDILTDDEKRLQERVLAAVKEAYQAEQKRQEGEKALKLLLATSQDLIRDAQSLNPQKRAEYEVAVRMATSVIEGKGQSFIPVASSLKDGQIVDLNGELKTVVINLGKNQGVREGMPFWVLRQDKVIGRLTVILARSQLSAALVDQSVGGKANLKVGDRVAVATEK